MHQGWPKFAAHLWMRSPGGGLASVAYAPCTVSADVAGEPVQIELRTDYPFGETLEFTVRADSPVRFPLYLRIPAWAEEAEVAVEGEHMAARGGTFCRIEREWGEGATVALRLPMRVRTQRRYHGSVSIERGSLVYALKMGEDWRLIGGEPPHGDWEVHPTAPWNYGLRIDPDHPDESIAFESGSIGACPFSPDGAPVVARVTGQRVPEWRIEHNAAGPLPQSPVRSAEMPEELVLVPYGCTNLRVTEFPVLG
jgi:hypothetical protein